MKIGYPKFTLATLYLVIAWHLGHSAIVADRDLTAVGAMLGAIATGVLYFVGADVWKEHVRENRGSKSGPRRDNAT